MKLKPNQLVTGVALCVLAMVGVSSTAFAFDHSYQSYGSLLSQCVEEGLVDYKSMQSKPELLNQAVDDFVAVAGDEFSTFSTDQQLAFWINAYNLFTIKAIVDHYPVKSIKNISGVWDKIRYSITGKELTLDNIEHDILRKEFNEPRIHVAIVCASVSCPELWDHPFTADSIDEQLELRSQSFVQDTTRNRWDNKNRRLYLSKILDWYGGDFKSSYLPAEPFPEMEGKDGAVAHFYYRHSDDAIRAQMTDGSFKIRHLKYDWSLNDNRE